jgi:methylenetetrahydrofolate--tRNA-(uracil-5-)-methyltransferase
MRFGPLKPVGLPLPGGGEPYAVAQLRREDAPGSMYNLVGFQTRLTRPEQQRVFRMIPGLEQAEFLRFGAMHRNTYLDSPRLLGADLRLKSEPRIFFAGQITGVEGYVESAACGLAAGLNAARALNGQPPLIFPRETALGALLNYISTDTAKAFAPMNINFGLLPPLNKRIRDKQQKNQALAERALETIEKMSLEFRM